MGGNKGTEPWGQERHYERLRRSDSNGTGKGRRASGGVCSEAGDVFLYALGVSEQSAAIVRQRIPGGTPNKQRRA